MAWTTTTNVSAGSVLTASKFNTEVLSNLNEVRGDFATSRHTSSNLTLNSTTWANVSGPADLVLAADAGDIVECSISCAVGNEAVDLYLDVVTMISTTVTNSFATNGAVSATGQGIVAWSSIGSRFERIGGCFYYKLVSGDISGSNVTLRLRYRTASATNRSVFCSTDNPFVFFARNHGPIEI